MNITSHIKVPLRSEGLLSVYLTIFQLCNFPILYNTGNICSDFFYKRTKLMKFPNFFNSAEHTFLCIFSQSWPGIVLITTIIPHKSLIKKFKSTVSADLRWYSLHVLKRTIELPCWDISFNDTPYLLKTEYEIKQLLKKHSHWSTERFPDVRWNAFCLGFFFDVAHLYSKRYEYKDFFLWHYSRLLQDYKPSVLYGRWKKWAYLLT